jgi:glyoxylase-like metal-dependent hydrolase (beta-lactamase superfamily II)
LGDLKIKTILTPGHSRGSICFHVDNALFSGDLLFHRSIGHTGFMGGSDEEIVESVLRIYDLFPDNTKVYPGHGPFTDIGSEKRENRRVRAD